MQSDLRHVLVENLKNLTLKGDARSILSLCQTNKDFRNLCNNANWQSVYQRLYHAAGVDEIYVPDAFDFRAAVQRLAKLQEESSKMPEGNRTRRETGGYEDEDLKTIGQRNNFLNSLAPTLTDMYKDGKFVNTSPIDRAVNGNYKYMYDTMRPFLHMDDMWSYKAVGMFEDTVTGMVEVLHNARVMDDNKIRTEEAMWVVHGMLISDKKHLVHEFMTSVTFVQGEEDWFPGIQDDIEFALPAGMDIVREQWMHMGTKVVRKFAKEELR